jgi:hypothetical protein
MKNIENLIKDCHNCLLKGKQDDQIKMSINCLETILYKKIDENKITIINKKFDNDDNHNDIYDHVFLCDGYQSQNRKKYIYSDEKISPIKYLQNDKVIFVLYTNLKKIDDVITEECINDESNKFMFNAVEFHDNGIDLDILIAFISIIYNINNRYSSLQKKENINLKEKNIWSTGYENFDEFEQIFENTIEYIKVADNNNIISVLQDFGVNVTENMRLLLSTQKEMPSSPATNSHRPSDIFRIFSNFLKVKLEEQDSLDKPFMVHSVTPNLTSHGIILDDKIETLLYANKYNEDKDKCAWLVGDSANAYPPGHSLLIGLKDAFFLVNNMMNTHFGISNYSNNILPDDFNIFDCDSHTNTYKFYEKYFENFKNLENINFVDGFINKNEQIKNNIRDVIEIVKTKKCNISNSGNNNSDLISEYNKYQLNNFFYNLKRILTDPTNFGGKFKNIFKQKNKKSHKKIRQKNHTKKSHKKIIQKNNTKKSHKKSHKK